MEYRNRLQEFGAAPTDAEIAAIVCKAAGTSAENHNENVYRTCLASLDATWLGATDNETRIAANVRDVIAVCSLRGLPSVASMCVYPNFVDTVGLVIGDSGIRISSVAGAFPDAQTFLEVKMLEAAMAVENGADEIDIVMNPGLIIEAKYEEAANEMEIIRREIGEDVTMKIIIESGSLGDADRIRTASLLAMMAGADFIKSSTGRSVIGATPEAVAAICCAIRDYASVTGRKVGFKASGGIRTASDAASIYTIVESILGNEWLDPSLFRIGSSTLFADLADKLQ